MARGDFPRWGVDRHGCETAFLSEAVRIIRGFGRQTFQTRSATPRIAPEKWAFTLKIGPNIITSKASVRPVHRARLSRVVTAALLSEVALIVAFPDLRSKVPEDPARNRDVEEEVRQHQVPDVVVAVGRLSGSMGAYRSRTNADDRLPRASCVTIVPTAPAAPCARTLCPA